MIRVLDNHVPSSSHLDNNGVSHDIGPLRNYPTSSATALSDNAQVVGDSEVINSRRIPSHVYMVPHSPRTCGLPESLQEGRDTPSVTGLFRGLRRFSVPMVLTGR
jgi:hypothetical protein